MVKEVIETKVSYIPESVSKNINNNGTDSLQKEKSLSNKSGISLYYLYEVQTALTVIIRQR